MPSHEERILESLRALADKLQHGVSHQQSSPELSHYRDLPESVTQSYDVLLHGAQLVHGTATKFTLVGKIDLEKTQPLQDQLLQGCELVATGCVAICADMTGCTRSARRHARQAARNIVQSVISLVEAMASYSGNDPNEKIDAAASKTGVVWEACDFVTNNKLPKGNRNAIRRDLLTYKMECQETLQEFQQIIDEGPCPPGSDNETSRELPADDGDLWQDFLGGQTDQYSETEFTVAMPCLALLKCTRGSLNVTLDSMETIGKDPSNFSLISDLFEKVALVGEGLTDLGAALYAPLDLNTVEQESKRQVAAVREVLEFIHSVVQLEGAEAVQFPHETVGLVTQIAGALEKREHEILDAISLAQR